MESHPSPHPLTSDAVDHNPLVVGHGRADDRRVCVATDALAREGLYIAGTDPAQRTELLTQLLVQWAETGRGFCYLHPDPDQPLELLAKLPADRLDDVVWIDLQRTRLADYHGLDVPRHRRITVSPLSDADTAADSDALETPPQQARLQDFLDVYTQHTRASWAVGSLLETLVDHWVSIGESGQHLAWYLTHFADAAPGSHKRGYILSDLPQSVSDELRAVADRDSSIIDRAAALVYSLAVTPHYATFRQTSNHSVREAISEDAILLVAGDTCHADPPWQTVAHASTRATQLLATTVIRRIWEALQARDGTRRPLFPIAVDHVDQLLPRDGRVLRELLERHEADRATRASPWLAGPAPGHLSPLVQDTVQAEFGCWALLSAEPDHPLRQTLKRVARRADRAESTEDGAERTLGFAFGQSWLAVPGRGPLAFDLCPPVGQHDDATIAAAITDSIRAHGVEVPERQRRLPTPGR